MGAYKPKPPFLRSSVVEILSVVASFLVLSAFLTAQGKSWTLPDGALNEKNPLASAPDVLKKGESLYKSNCAGCHGPKGLGDGPNVDKGDRRSKPANLTLSRNPEGIVFYKIWNGRKDPDMPAFKSRMTKDEAWAIVTFVTSLRSSQP